MSPCENHLLELPVANRLLGGGHRIEPGHLGGRGTPVPDAVVLGGLVAVDLGLSADSGYPRPPIASSDDDRRDDRGPSPRSSGSKVKAPNATGPLPGTPTSSSTSKVANNSCSELVALSKRSVPGSMTIRAASPHATRPSPCCTHARPSWVLELLEQTRRLELDGDDPESPSVRHRFVPVSSCTAPRPKRRTLTSLKPAFSSSAINSFLGGR